MSDRSSSVVRLVLASASPRREALLREHGYRFEIDPADIDESAHPPGLSPPQLAAYLAKAKAVVVSGRRASGAIVLGADTVVGVGSEIFGKPADLDEARRMLGRLGGSTHQVITGIALARGGQVLASEHVISEVQMRRLSDPELDAYLAGGEWRGKAGSYGIQDPDPFVTRISGSLTNIVGLPMEKVAELLQRVGIVPGDQL